MSTVILENVSKSFGSTVAVDDLSMQIDSGEFFSILGPSGCGKTTTMRMIVGLETPDKGRIWIDDRLVFDSSTLLNVNPGDRDVGLVFQEYALWPHMTVKDNVLFGLRTRGIPPSECVTKLESIARQMQISELTDRFPNELSGGQQQRVALARELVVGKKVLLMDEPLSNLDSKLRAEMRLELKSLHDETGCTIIYVTHDQTEALMFSEKMVVMDSGRVQQLGSPDDIFFKPKNLFTASFIGTMAMNKLPARIESDCVVGDGFKLSIKSDHREDQDLKGLKNEVIVAFRPDDARMSANNGPAMFSGFVNAAVNMGNIAVVQVNLGAQNTSTLPNNMITIQIDRPKIDVKPGDKIQINVEPRVLYLFEGDTDLTVENVELGVAPPGV